MLLVYYSTIFILEKPKVRSIFPFLVILKTDNDGSFPVRNFMLFFRKIALRAEEHSTIYA